MKTATLIKRTFLFFIATALLLLCERGYKNYATNKAVNEFVEASLEVLPIFIVLALTPIPIMLLLGLFCGEFDKWFETHTDPIIKKVQDFFNRRNNGL